MNRIVMTTEARAWVKRSGGPGELVRIVPDELDSSSRILTYQLSAVTTRILNIWV